MWGAMPEQPSINEWRHDTERAELVERVIRLHRENLLLQRTLRDLTEAAAEDQAFGAYILILQNRIRVLEENVERLTKKGHRAA